MTEPLKLLKQYFGYQKFRTHQEEIISAVLDNRDVLVLMPTGGGKSVCYQIPALLKEGMALVISPLISLMKDQVEALTANGIAAGFINSSMTAAEEQDMVRRCQEGLLKLLYISPEKALAVSNSLLRTLPLSLIAIDEAHCISQWGHDFRPEYTQLKNLRTNFEKVPVIALTATADKVTRRDIVEQLALNDPAVFVSSFDRPNFHLSVRRQVQKKQKDEEILAFIQEHPDQCGIVYCLSRKSTEELCGFLRDRGVQADHYHAGMNAEERSRVQEDFIFDRCRVICATIAFGMGIDKSNVRWIIHYNLPKNMEGYYQEIGRAGRDGAPAKTLLYYNIADLMMLNRFAADSGQPELNVEKLRRMQQYAEARVCRRKILLGYFGEHYDRHCHSCDVCDDPPKYMDGTLIAQKAISALLRANESIGIHMLVDILRGSMNAELVAAGYDKLKTHGAGREYSQQAWQGYIPQLLQLGIFEMAYDEGFSLKVSDYGKQQVRGTGSIELAGEQPGARKDFSKTKNARPSKEDGLFGELRLLRRQIAEQEGLPPYVIFHDSSLLEMADQWPVSRQEMLAIPGMSYSKYIKYGHYFENRIRELAKDRILPERFDPDIYLSEEKIRSYVEELKKFDLRISHALIGRLLLASDRDMPSEELKELSFYGALAGKTNYKMIGPILQQRYKKLGIPAARPAEMKAQQYFEGPARNGLPVEERNSAIQIVRSFERNRPDETVDNAYILDARKTYPRAYEFWSEEENDLLLELCRKTNDLDELAHIFQRNPASIRSQFVKLARS